MRFQNDTDHINGAVHINSMIVNNGSVLPLGARDGGLFTIWKELSYQVYTGEEE